MSRLDPRRGSNTLLGGLKDDALSRTELDRMHEARVPPFHPPSLTLCIEQRERLRIRQDHAHHARPLYVDSLASVSRHGRSRPVCCRVMKLPA